MARHDLRIEAGLGGRNVPSFLRRRRSWQTSDAREPPLLTNGSSDDTPAPSKVPMGRRRSWQTSDAREPPLLTNGSSDDAPAPSKVPIGRRRSWGGRSDESTAAHNGGGGPWTLNNPKVHDGRGLKEVQERSFSTVTPVAVANEAQQTGSSSRSDDATSFLSDPKSILRRRSVAQEILSSPDSCIGSPNSVKDSLRTSVISDVSTRDSQSPREEQLMLDISYIRPQVPQPQSKTDEILARLNARSTNSTSAGYEPPVEAKKGQQPSFKEGAKRLKERLSHLNSQAQSMTEADKDAGSRKDARIFHSQTSQTSQT